jgi:hypothetical protein
MVSVSRGWGVAGRPFGPGSPKGFGSYRRSPRGFGSYRRAVKEFEAYQGRRGNRLLRLGQPTSPGIAIASRRLPVRPAAQGTYFHRRPRLVRLPVDHAVLAKFLVCASTARMRACIESTSFSSKYDSPHWGHTHAGTLSRLTWTPRRSI